MNVNELAIQCKDAAKLSTAASNCIVIETKPRLTNRWLYHIMTVFLWKYGTPVMTFMSFGEAETVSHKVVAPIHKSIRYQL